MFLGGCSVSVRTTQWEFTDLQSWLRIRPLAPLRSKISRTTLVTIIALLFKCRLYAFVTVRFNTLVRLAFKLICYVYVTIYPENNDLHRALFCIEKLFLLDILSHCALPNFFFLHILQGGKLPLMPPCVSTSSWLLYVRTETFCRMRTERQPGSAFWIIGLCNHTERLNGQNRCVHLLAFYF